MFSLPSDQNSYRGQLQSCKTSHCEGGTNNSNIVLRVVTDDEKGTNCLEVSLGYPVPLGAEPGPPGWGSLKFQTVKYSHESRGDSDPRGTAL
jgi:hypothetical protein